MVGHLALGGIGALDAFQRELLTDAGKGEGQRAVALTSGCWGVSRGTWLESRPLDETDSCSAIATLYVLIPSAGLNSMHRHHPVPPPSHLPPAKEGKVKCLLPPTKSLPPTPTAS